MHICDIGWPEPFWQAQVLLPSGLQRSLPRSCSLSLGHPVGEIVLLGGPNLLVVGALKCCDFSYKAMSFGVALHKARPVAPPHEVFSSE